MNTNYEYHQDRVSSISEALCNIPEYFMLHGKGLLSQAG
jgi:hypothetical protein